jgi:two-component system, OmpR family, phosphate regulon sensor histidine kinase PhoR
MVKIRLVILLGVACVLGIVGTQVYWLQNAWNVKERQFQQEAFIALSEVARQIALLNNIVPSINFVQQLSPDYFVVNVNSEIDANVLEYYLKTEFQKKNLFISFEYGIYNCSTDEVVYGKYVQMKQNIEIFPKNQNLPKWEKYNYYFGIRFPEKASFLLQELHIWVGMSAILGVVVVFFGYAMFIILKQKRLSELQKDFINNLTHEFKTPISTISLATQTLLKPEILSQPERHLKYVSIITNENNRLKNQVERVLQLARIEKEEVQLQKEKIQLDDFLQDFLKNWCEQYEIILKLNVPQIAILADKVHFGNVMNTILDNATKYAEKKPSIVVSTQKMDKYAQISIQDNGIGIAPEHQKHIFDRFYRVSTGNIHDIKGFGLGLNYVKMIARLHRWEVFLKSEKNVGTIITLKINVL